jgi:glycine dehydrogenase subunit 1
MPSPYIGISRSDQEAMLKDIGVQSVEDLFKDIPEKLRNGNFNLPPSLSEIEVKKLLYQMSNQNANLNDYACFLGAGNYRHFIPGTVEHVISRSEFFTAYTPYQAETSQGTLQAMYEYQSLVCQLTGMEVSNAGLYDVSTAAAEAAVMACSLTQRLKIIVSGNVNPGYQQVINSYASGRGLEVDVVANLDSSGISAESACLIVQNPNFYGSLEDLANCSLKAHNAGALLIVIVNPISLGMYRTPASYGADIVVADGQSLGNPVSFGGPNLGIFTCRKEYLRQMPGRIVGKTVDAEGKPGYVMTLVTREQHIRRERATSNICTSEALLALAVTVYLATLGKAGLFQVAKLCYQKAHYAADRINQLKGFSLAFQNPFFNEFVVTCPVDPKRINQALLKEKIIGGLDLNPRVKNGMLICVTEMNTREEIDKLVKILGNL